MKLKGLCYKYLRELRALRGNIIVTWFSFPAIMRSRVMRNVLSFMKSDGWMTAILLF